MDVPEKANGPETSAVYSLSRNDLLGNILYSGCSAGELLIFRSFGEEFGSLARRADLRQDGGLVM